MSHYKSSPLRSSLRKHGGRQKSPGRKTVSFCSNNSEKKVSNVTDCFQYMQNGTEMVKLRTNVRQFRRVFSLDADLSHIRWTPTNKKPHKARISVDSIKEVRVGRNTELLRATENANTDMQEECAFSIIYGDDYMCLDLIALSPDDANIWVTGLMALTSGPKVENQPSGSMATLRERWLESAFDEADSEKKGYVSEKSAVRLIRLISPRLLVNRVKQKVKEVSTSCLNEALRGRIDKEQFIDIYKDVATRPEVYFLMVRYANKDYLSIKDLQIFLETEQDSSIFDQSQKNICHDMDHPLSHYFIASSFNTYLVEDQIKGPSSVDGFISALKRCCRFIELDVWEPDEETELHEPIIYHGGTQTSKLALSAALSTINDLAFEKSSYPLLILSMTKNLVSMTEGNCLRMIHHNTASYSQVSRNFLQRVIPNTVRVDSSNMNPQEFWNFGLNIVALNYQTPGLMMDLQEGKFAANGGCGYVLKPTVMRDDIFTPLEKLPFTPQILHLKILSAQQLPRPRGSTAKGDSADPFVVIEVFGIPADCAEERTKTIRNDSFNPSFDENFQFEISVPELALVRFLVLDDDYIGDDFIGQYTVPFECLQSGYRHIPLLNNEGDPLENSTLFVHVAITNRRGGGKPKKRGMSVKRKTSRVQTGMKMIGIKSIDDLFKMAIAPLVESIEMRNQLESAMIEWQEQCGLGQTGTIRQGLRLIHTRIATAASSSSPPASPRHINGDVRNEDAPPSFMITKNADDHPVVKTSGNIPEALQKSFSSLDNLLKKCINILRATDDLLSKLSEATARISECYAEMPQHCAEAGLRGQKATRASENFAWNVRLLKAQLTLMHKTQTEANEIVFQVVDTAKILGVFVPTP
uniref:Phosphoinositide phospholipase C n=1 Tax=Panagrolaimus sp. PS1159 TaxID=55785 RepID=A0AC35G466_9BILA